MARHLQRRFTPDRLARFAPLAGAGQRPPAFSRLVGAFLGNTIEWRGQRLRLRSDGTLVDRQVNAD